MSRWTICRERTMGRLDREARNAMAVLLERGHTKSDVARLPGVSEGTVRYHDRRMREGAVDGRSGQQGMAAGNAAAIGHWRELQGAGAVSLASLHAWLVREHGYGGSLRSVQRYWKRTYPAPALRALIPMHSFETVRFGAFFDDAVGCNGGGWWQA